MPSFSEVGASNTQISDYRCSILKITLTNKSWKKPGDKVTQPVTVTAFQESSVKAGKTYYIVSNPKGKKMSVTVTRAGAQCPRDDHRKCKSTFYEYAKSGEEITLDAANIPAVLRPYVLYQKPLSLSELLADEKEYPFKFFEIGGVKEAFKYLTLPFPIEKENKATFSFCSCKQGFLGFNVISYPDISFEVTFKVGWKETEKRTNQSSHFERGTKYFNQVDDRFKSLTTADMQTEVKLAPPSLDASISYNGGKDKLELNINFNTEKEIFHLLYKHDGKQLEIGSQFFQEISRSSDKLTSLGRVLRKVCNAEFFSELVDFDPTKMVNSYQAYKFKMNPPSVVVSAKGQYCTSKDLERVGRYLDFSVACAPLVSVSLTIDLLFLILTSVSAGTATGIYVMLKNLDKVLEKLLGKKYKKDYKTTKPFSADIFVNLIITGEIKGEFHFIIDTTEQGKNSQTGKISGAIKVDLECGAKLSVDVFFIQVEAEAKATGSSGIEIGFGFADHMAQGKGISLLMETFFLGLKVTYMASAKVGLMKTVDAGVAADGSKELFKCKKIEMLSGEYVLFGEQPSVTIKNSGSGTTGSGSPGDAKYGAGSVVGIGK